jgi:beta-glucosidase
LGTATVTYTDGTTQSATVTFADWFANAATGGDIVTSVPYINNASGRQSQQVSLYYAAVPLQAGKTVCYLTLPAVSDTDGAVSGAVAMHIFAIAIGG